MLPFATSQSNTENTLICYSKYGVKNATRFRIRLKPNAQLITQHPQRRSTVPLPYRDNPTFTGLQKHNVKKRIGFSPQTKRNYGTTYLNPLSIIPKGDSKKCVFGASTSIYVLNKLTNHGPLDLLLLNYLVLIKIQKCYRLYVRLCLLPLDKVAMKLTSFFSGDNIFVLIRGFNALPNFFKNQLPSFFKTTLKQGFALFYNDASLLLPNSNEQTFQLVGQHRIITL